MTRHVFHPLYSTGTSFLPLAVLFIGTALSRGQTTASAALDAHGKVPAYEVISVKPSKPDCPGMMVSGSPGRYTAHCVTVWGLFYNAYAVRSFHDYPPGLPAWADKDKFDIDAKMGDDTVIALQKLPREQAGQQAQLMLQSLLADRFQLRVHHETRVQPIYNLVFAKGGSRLKPWPADEPPRGAGWGRSGIRIQGAGMDRLVICLSDTLSRAVVDNTGLTGKYDIDLKWTPDDQQGTADAGPTFFTALEEQLGLKLIPATGPVDTYVVDHVERPSEN